jgi:hypothetical protein
MVRQVRFVEDLQETPTTYFTHTIFGFGSFPGLTDDLEHQITSAAASNQRFRVIMDELLQGNFLEQISCRGPIDAAGDTWGTVPSGATPDDIAKCSEATGVLPVTCTGPYAVCVGPDPTHPVGVLDVNEDGAADAQRFMPGSVNIVCTPATGAAITVPLNLDSSYWNPSGNQEAPAMGGLDALGPAIVLVPTAAIPTSTTCGLVFSPTVIDKTNMSVCIPQYGLPPGITDDAGNIGEGCTPTGDPVKDYGQFSFKVEPLRLSDSSPLDGDMGVDLTDSASLTFIAAIDPLTVGSITVTQNGASFTDFTTTLSQQNQRVALNWPDGLMANSVYVITIPTTVTDAFEQPLPAPVTITFTTGS